MYRVESIIDRRPSQGKRKGNTRDHTGKFEYLVKWQGWKLADSTWEPEANLSNVREMLK